MNYRSKKKKSKNFYCRKQSILKYMYISIHVMAEELEILKLKTTSEISQLYKQHPEKTSKDDKICIFM